MTFSPPVSYGSDSLKVGDWIVEPDLSRISRDGEEHYLEPKLMAVLMYLVSHTDQIVSNDSLIHEVWDDRPMGDNPVYRCIAQLRKAFGDDRHNPNYIITIPKRGYRLIAPVARVEPESPPPDAHESPSAASNIKSGYLTPRMIGVAAAAIAAMAVFAIFSGGNGPENTAGRPAHALAVMPFSGNGDPEATVMGNGIAEEVSHQLSGTDTLRVIAHSSAASFDNENLDIDDATELLGVDHILVGSLHHEDNNISIQGRLLNARGEALWNHTFTARQDELFKLSNEIVQSIADSLNIRLDPEWVTACGGTHNVMACRQYKLASEQIRTRDSKDYKARALQLFEEAIVLDPGFAAAHAGIARTFLLPGSEFPWPEAVRQADTAIQRALELDDTLPEAYMAQAISLDINRRGPCPPVCVNLHGYEAAEQSVRHALSLSPGSPDAHNILAFTLSGQGKLREAASHYNTALMHDPLSPVVNYNIALFRAYRGDYAGALQYIQEFIEKHPNAPSFMYTAQAFIQYLYGAFDESLDSLNMLMNSPSGPLSDWLLTQNYHNLGLFDRIDEVLSDRQDAAYFNILSATTRQRLYITQDRLDDLAELSDALMEQAENEYGPSSGEWPRWLQRALGQSMFRLGNYDQAATYLSHVHGANGTDIDHHFIVAELDSLHAFGYSLKALGDTQQGEAIIDHTLTLLEQRKSQGYDGLPDLTAAQARAYAIEGNKALAVATMRKAVNQGWRGCRSISASDPRWHSVFDAPDFESLLARVQEDVDRMRARTETRLARLN